MDELKLLVETVAGLPTLTLWVLCGYLIYKLAVIGSIYGVIRYLADKFVEWRNKPPVSNFNGLFISETAALSFAVQLKRISSTQYIHESDVQKLKEIIDAMGKSK